MILVVGVEGSGQELDDAREAFPKLTLLQATATTDRWGTTH
ncbi:hypothetical protein ACWGNF_24565 [Streptomyces sp. NPDC055808]